MVSFEIRNNFKFKNHFFKKNSISATPSVLKELTDKCWQQNPADRPSLNRIVEILNVFSDLKKGIQNSNL